MKNQLLLSLSVIVSVLIAGGLKSEKSYCHNQDNLPSKFLLLMTLIYFSLAWLILNLLGIASLGWQCLVSLTMGVAITGLLFLSEMILVIIIFAVRSFILSLKRLFKKKAPLDEKARKARDYRMNYDLDLLFSVLVIMAIAIWSYAATDENWIISLLPIIIFSVTIIYIHYDPFYPLSFHPVLLLVILIMLYVWFLDAFKIIGVRKKFPDNINWNQ